MEQSRSRWYATANLFQMDINPLVNALWALWFSNKSAQLSTFGPAKYPTKAVLSVALPNPLISAVGAGLAHLSSALLPRCGSRPQFFTPFSFTTSPLASKWRTLYILYFDFGRMVRFGQWHVDESHSVSIPSLRLKRPHMFLLIILYLCHHCEKNMHKLVLWPKEDEKCVEQTQTHSPLA